MWLLTVCGVLAAVVLIPWRWSGQPLAFFLGRGLVWVYARLWHRLAISGAAPLPGEGPAILVANHTCSADPAFLTAGCRRPLSFLIAHEYFSLPVVRWLCRYLHCVPVKRNGQDVAAVRASLRHLHEGRIVCIFPEGNLSNAGRRCVRPGKLGIALLALRSRAPVFPAWIEGGPQTSDVPRAWLRPSRVRVAFGPAVDLTPYYDRPITRKLLHEVATRLMHHVAALAPKPNGSRNDQWRRS
jgi:1-acyl-sn-glycerol-3-phosphate acyltransferase